MHLSIRHIPLGLSSNLVSDEIKKAIATTLFKYPQTDFQTDKPELSKVGYIETLLCMGSSILKHGYVIF